MDKYFHSLLLNLKYWYIYFTVRCCYAGSWKHQLSVIWLCVFYKALLCCFLHSRHTNFFLSQSYVNIMLFHVVSFFTCTIITSQIYWCHCLVLLIYSRGMILYNHHHFIPMTHLHTKEHHAELTGSDISCTSRHVPQGPGYLWLSLLVLCFPRYMPK